MAAARDVLQGKIWAALDETRRPSKRQKDLADILRFLEKRPGLAQLIPRRLKLPSILRRLADKHKRGRTSPISRSRTGLLEFRVQGFLVNRKTHARHSGSS